MTPALTSIASLLYGDVEVFFVNAIYDLRCAPITFDFCNYLAIVYMVSRYHKADRFNLTIRADSFRNSTPREKTYSIHDRNWRLSNLLIEVAKSCSAVSNLCVSRDEQLENRLTVNQVPVGYDFVRRSGIPYLLSQAKQAYLHTNVRPVLFAPSPYASRVAETLVGTEPFITITLRQASFDTARNCNLNEWALAMEDFSKVHNLKVIVIPDQDDALSGRQVFSKNWLVLEYAAFSLDLRLAVMSRAVENFVSSGGMAAPLWYSNIRYVMFNIVHEGHYVADKNYLKNSAGLSIGESLAWAEANQCFEWEHLDPFSLISKYTSKFVS